MAPRLFPSFKALAGEFRAALGFLTRIGLPGSKQGAPPPLAQTMRAFPLVGAVIGVIGGVVYLIACPLLPSLAAAALALAATVAVTGALHEDGLADVADGFGGGHDREAKLAIMRDSRVGSYGVVTLALVLLLRASALSGLTAETGFWVLIGVHTAARATIPALMRLLPTARKDGLGARAGIPSQETTVWAIALGTLILGLTLTPTLVLCVLAGCALATAAVAVLAKRQIGGFTGDVLGAAEQVAETAALLLVVGAA